MAFELIHTSSPRGIDPNARGFTTVAMSQGLGGVWRSRLESLSSYAVEDGVGGQPVITRHVLLQVAGSKRHVLSRIAPCGLDYTGRPNRIAHHIVLDASECPTAGPAWLLQQHNLFHQQWDRDPVVLNGAPTLADANLPPAPCRAWQQRTGDAGHAGHLLRHWQRGERKQLVLVVPDGVSALALFAEAVALLDPGDRWRATFSTLSQQLPTDATCAVQVAMAGTRTARTALAHPGMLTLDLSALPPCPEDACTQAARTGMPLPSSRGAGGVTVPGGAVIDPRIAAAERAAAAEAAAAAAHTAQQSHQPAAAWQTPGHESQPIAVGNDPVGLSPEGQHAAPYAGHYPPRGAPGGYPQQRTNLLPWIFGGAAVMLIALVSIVVAVSGGKSSPDQPPPNAQNNPAGGGGTGDDDTGGGGNDDDGPGDGGNDGDNTGGGGGPEGGGDDSGNPADEVTGACVIAQICEMLNEDVCEAQGGLFVKRASCSAIPTPLDAINITHARASFTQTTFTADSDGDDKGKHYWFIDGSKPTNSSQLTRSLVVGNASHRPSVTGTSIAAVDVQDKIVVAVGRFTWKKQPGTQSEPVGQSDSSNQAPATQTGACCTVELCFEEPQQNCQGLYVGDGTTCCDEYLVDLVISANPSIRKGGKFDVTATPRKPRDKLTYRWFLDGKHHSDTPDHTLPLNETDLGGKRTLAVQVVALRVPANSAGTVTPPEVIGYDTQDVVPTKSPRAKLLDLKAANDASTPIDRASWQGRSPGNLKFKSDKRAPKTLQIVAHRTTDKPLKLVAWTYVGNNSWSTWVTVDSQDPTTLTYHEPTNSGDVGRLDVQWADTDVAFFVVRADEGTEHERVWTLLSDELEKGDRAKANEFARKMRDAKWDTATWSRDKHTCTFLIPPDEMLEKRGELDKPGHPNLPMFPDDDNWVAVPKATTWHYQPDRQVHVQHEGRNWILEGNPPEAAQTIWLIDRNGRLAYVLNPPPPETKHASDNGADSGLKPPRTNPPSKPPSSPQERF